MAYGDQWQHHGAGQALGNNAAELEQNGISYLASI